MAFSGAEFLEPVSAAAACGPDAREHPAFDALRALGQERERADGKPRERPDWARQLEPSIELARASRDLRAWVWLTRASLCAEGVAGLEAGLALIARGLERYWDELPPLYPDEPDPRERYLGRLMALTELGVTNYRANLDDLGKNGRSLADLRVDLDAMVAKAPADPATRAAVDRARAAVTAIARLVGERFGPAADPQLGFELLLGKLAAIEAKVGAASAGVAAAAAAAVGPAAAEGAPSTSGPVRSRDDVVRALDLVLRYYAEHEPSSPVPLLVQRAKRLVSLSFLDAIRDLAPTGLKELQAVAGATDEKR